MRWRPTRAGIFNVWEYDDQTFEFGDGRLALRGRNGSGKSNALALLFPFILDAVMSAARMDPMGGGRSMKSLLLGRDDDDRAGRYRHDSGTGYVWMEFGDGERHLTIGIGAVATQHRDAEPWFFVTTQRVGHDLELADNDTPLGRRQLEERLTDGGTVYKTADEYRAAVDRHLLGLGERRFRRLVDLLLTLRRPHLAGKLDTDHLSATLSAGLGELDPALIDDVAHSFDDLDAMQHELDGLAASLTAVDRFLPVYRQHLVAAGRHRAQAVVDALGALGELDREARGAQRQLDTAIAQEVDLTTRAAETEAGLGRLGAEIDTIRESPAYQNATALDEVRRSAGNAERTAEQAATTARRSSADASQAVERATAARSEAAARQADVVAAVAAWVEAARSAGVEVPFTFDFDDTWATSIVTQRRHEVAQVRQLARQAAETSERARQAERYEARALTERQAADSELSRAADEVARQRSDLADQRARWATDLAAIVGTITDLAVGFLPPSVAHPWGERSSADDDGLDAAAEDELQAFHRADRLVGEVDLVHARALDAAADAAARQQKAVDDLGEERGRVESEPNPGPPANPTRPDAGVDGAPGVPLYVCVDFAEGVDPATRAGLEAALGAAGILDAEVTPEDGPLATFDAALVAGWTGGSGGGVTLADVLVPVAVAGVSTERIAAVLRSIPVDGDTVKLGRDGTWQLGPLAGRFTQPDPLFIGHAARERRRTERLAALDRQIASESAALADLERRHERLLAAGAALSATRAEQPPVASLGLALDNYRTWWQRLEERTRAHEAARADAEAAFEMAEAASIDVQRTATRLRLPADTDALQEIDGLLRDCDGHRRHVASVQTTAAMAARTADQADDNAGKMAQRAASDQAAGAEAATFAQLQRTRYQQLLANVGGDAQQAVEALARARDLRLGLLSVAQEIAGELRVVHSTRATLTERISAYGQRRVTLAADLGTAELHFGVFCTAEIVEVLAVEGVEPGADPHLASRRLLAGTEPELEDAINRMERAYREILLDGLRAGHDPSMPKVAGVDVVRVGTVDGDLPIGTLARQLRQEHERTSQLLTKQEREIFETHLLTRIGDGLRQLLLDADAFEHRINEEMSKVPTESSLIVELRWEPAGDDPGLRDAIRALRTAPELLGPDRREELREFFMLRIADVRTSEPGRSFTDTLTAVLDYRAWHQFTLYARFSSGKRQRVTRTFFRDLSGGEAATVLHLPLFAAAAAQYSNGSVDGPRIIALDEAFVGIDDKMRARLMGLLTQLDLDVILTSHEFWGFYDTVPALVLYDLVRRPPTPGVYAQRLDWSTGTVSDTHGDT